MAWKLDLRFIAMVFFVIPMAVLAGDYDPKPYEGIYNGTKPGWYGLNYIRLPEYDLMDDLSGYSSTMYYYEEIDGYVIYSHRNPACKGNISSHRCRKGMVRFKRSLYSPGKTREHEFAFSFKPGTDFPDFAIIFQDWVDLDGDPSTGHRPITTLKLRKCSDNKYYLQHYDNSWQLNELTQPTIPDNTCGEPNSLRTDTLHGSMEVDTWQSSGSSVGNYYIKIVTRDDNYGPQPSVEVYVNGSLFSTARYKTTYPEREHVIMEGLYWNKGYNSEHNPDKSLRLVIWGFDYSEY
ncbi:hypothetical protein MHM95_09100 [Pseudoalteromonas sp. CnMc7-15]|uniref:hypothetical protein n=1 Tax=unclassified Pseudoalteromonas TaxID=194690 RepID=UPI001EF6C84B|nr:hypothetical protein [Pseudoalteromonas sp. CnMc7-15]MCG7566446.1 hypothetical protein [Pseudoalteromonas sp. CnMc7-15]